MNKIQFRVVARTKSESEKEGIVYQVKFKSSEGHRLVLKSKDKTMLEGYALGEYITVDLKNPQTTLGSSS